MKFIKAALKGWEDVKNKSKEVREKWIIEKMAGKNNKEQSATKRSANELILGRNEKEDNIIDSEYYEAKPSRMLTAEEINKSKAREEAKRKEILMKRLRNKREDLEVGDKILVKTEKNTGKPKYNEPGTVKGRGENGEVIVELTETGATTSRTEDHVRLDTR